MPDFAFISHVWLGKNHPDPTGAQLSLLKAFLQGIMDGGLSIHNYWLEHLIAPSSIEASTLQKSLRNGYIWIDYLCVPQHNKADMANAINSLHCYIQEASHFFVVQPASTHENGLNYDIRTWGKRGWCRAERLCNVLSPSVKPVVMVESMVSKYTAMPRDWLLNPVGAGNFTVDSDRRRLGFVIDSMLTERQRRALSENEFLFYRLLESMKTRIMFGCTFEEEIVGESVAGNALAQKVPNKVFVQWMVRMQFTAFDDEQSSGWSPLRFAIYAGRLDIARELLSQGADVEAPLEASFAQYGLHNRGCTILGGLCGLRPDPEGIRFLLQHDANPFLTDEFFLTPLHLAGQAGFSENISVLMSLAPELAPIPDVHGCTAWIRLVMSGNKDAFTNYVNNFADTMSFDPNWCNWHGAGVLCHAIMDVGDADVLQATIDLGYDINHRADITKSIRFPLRLMKMSQVASFLKRGSEPPLVFYMANFPGFTALTCSAFFNNTAQLKVCLAAKADVSTVNDYNRTALMFAAMNGNEEMVQILLEATSPLGVVDNWGRTAAEWAQTRGYSEIADKLRSVGDVRRPRDVRRPSVFHSLANHVCKVMPCMPCICADNLARRTQLTPNIAPPSRSAGSPLQGICDLFLR
jgi:ankyrin repeat protein